MPELLKFKYPYSFEKTFHRLVVVEKSAYKQDQPLFRRPLRGRKGPLLLTISSDSNGNGLWFDIEGELGANEWDELRKQVRKMFSLDVNLEPFYELACRDENLFPLVEERKGMHLVLEPTLYECLVKTIISQQLNLAFAATLTQRFIQLKGEKFHAQGKEWTVFPTPEQVATLKAEDLQALQFNRRKAEYIIDLSRLIVEGKLDLEELEYLSDEEVMERLLPIRGIGRWTVECVLLFGLGRPNLLPAADIGLRNAIKHFYGLRERPNEKTVRQIGESWSPYRSYATFYLWDALSDVKKKKNESKNGANG